jgi:hypothetical protein
MEGRKMKEVDKCMGGIRRPHAKRNTDTNGVWDNTHKDKSTTIDSSRAYNHSIINRDQRHRTHYSSLHQHPQRRANPQTTNIPNSSHWVPLYSNRKRKTWQLRPKTSRSQHASVGTISHRILRAHTFLSISTHFQRRQEMLRYSSTNRRHAFFFFFKKKKKETPFIVIPKQNCYHHKSIGF